MFLLSLRFFPVFSYSVLQMCIKLYGSQNFFSNCLETHYASSIILSDKDGIKSTKQIKMQILDSYRKVKRPLNILQWQRVNMKLNRKEKKAPCCTISSLEYPVTSLTYLKGSTTLLSPTPSITPQRGFRAYPLHIRKQKYLTVALIW